MSPDPYMASGGPGDPGSWNRYAYVEGDPVNRADPGGQSWIDIGNWLIGNPGAPNTWNTLGCDYYCQVGTGIAAAVMAAFYQQLQAAQAPPPPPDCWLKVEYRPVNGLSQYNHLSVVVHDKWGYTFTMQAFPENDRPPFGLMNAKNAYGDIGDTQLGYKLTSSAQGGNTLQINDLCDKIRDIEDAEAFYLSDRVQYSPRNRNSNTFAYWLLEHGFVYQYFHPSSAPGWGNPLYN